MKKLFLVFLILSLLLPATIANAARKVNPPVNNSGAEKVQNSKIIQAELKLLQKQITLNTDKLVNLKKVAKDSFNRAKNRLMQLMKKKENMTQEKIDLLKDAADSLQLDSKALNDTSDELDNMYANLQNANSGTNYQLIQQYMNDIINLQKIRIDNLQQAINDMNRIAKL